ncbi:MAG: hypothetical protein ACLTBV_11435 [Enterocloster bolteae]
MIDSIRVAQYPGRCGALNLPFLLGAFKQADYDIPQPRSAPEAKG